MAGALKAVWDYWSWYALSNPFGSDMLLGPVTANILIGASVGVGLGAIANMIRGGEHS